MGERNAQERVGVVVEDHDGVHLSTGEARVWFATKEGAASLGLGAGDLVQSRWDDGTQGWEYFVVAKARDPAAQLYALALSFGISPLFSKEIEAEAQGLLAAPGLQDTDLIDLEAKPFVTIDNEDSRDLDQALCIEHFAETGHFVVWYALADASFYCPPESAMFGRALQQGASFYLPGLVLPMLPPSMSEGLISLNPQVPRRAVVFRMELDGQGECLRTTVQRGRIRSRAKLSYAGVQRYHDDLLAGEGSGDLLHHGHDYSPTLRWLRTVGELRIDRAGERDVVAFRRKDVHVQLEGTHGRSFCLVSDERHDVERWNEQISLLCNMEGARLLERAQTGNRGRNVQAIFRTHPAPSPQRMDGLCQLIDALVELHGLPHHWRWQPSTESLAHYLRRLPNGGQQGRIALAIHRQAMVLSQRSVFNVVPSPHHGVGAEVYARFSAPMREVVGIFTHKEALELLAGRGEMAPAAEDLVLQTAVVEAANRAKDTQAKLTKEANGLGIHALLSEDLGSPSGTPKWRRGTILGLSTSRVYVQLDTPTVELKVYLDGIRDRVRCDPREVCLWEGHAAIFRLGDEVEVAVRGYDERRRRWDLELRSPLSGSSGLPAVTLP